MPPTFLRLDMSLSVILSSVPKIYMKLSLDFSGFDLSSTAKRLPDNILLDPYKNEQKTSYIFFLANHFIDHDIIIYKNIVEEYFNIITFDGNVVVCH